MRTILHIKTDTFDALAAKVVDAQRADDALRVETADLTGEDPDYQAVLEQIYAADSVAVW